MTVGPGERTPVGSHRHSDAATLKLQQNALNGSNIPHIEASFGHSSPPCIPQSRAKATFVLCRHVSGYKPEKKVSAYTTLSSTENFTLPPTLNHGKKKHISITSFRHSKFANLSQICQRKDREFPPLFCWACAHCSTTGYDPTDRTPRT
jgi:hypothetical protein